MSRTSEIYSIESLDESNSTKVIGYPDDLKLRSSMTLFAEATPEYDVFQKVLDKFYGGAKDERTLEILRRGARNRLGFLTEN